METGQYIITMRTIEKSLLEFIDNESNNEELFQNLIHIFDEQKITENRELFKSTFYLISSIANNHHRSTSFFTKIEQIIKYYKEFIVSTYSNEEIFENCLANKKILLFLFEEKILTIDQKILHIFSIDYIFTTIPAYFYPEIKPYNQYIIAPQEGIEEKRKNYENENPICELIRKDLLDEFIIFVHKNCIQLITEINPSVIETNEFLMLKKPSLIEYAAFFGSINIFKYLLNNNIGLTSQIWLYSIHGNNPEIIGLIEDQNVEPPNNSYELCFEEAIKCHHNDIAEYFKDNYLNSPDFINFGLKYYNFSYIQEDLIDIKDLFQLISSDYAIIVDNLVKNPSIDINHMFVF